MSPAGEATKWLPRNRVEHTGIQIFHIIRAKSVKNLHKFTAFTLISRTTGKFPTSNGKTGGNVMLNASNQTVFCQGPQCSLADAHVFPDRIYEAVARERRRIARDLHDNAGQYLVGIAFKLKALELYTADEASRRSISDIRGLLFRFGEEIRATCSGNRGGLPNGQGLISAVNTLTSEWQRSTGIAVSFDHEVNDGAGFDDDEAEAVFRIIQEALTNVAKHAASASRVDIRLRIASGRIKLSIADDAATRSTSPSVCCSVTSGGTGISGMRDRVSELGGHLWIRHMPGRGARLVAII
jgi:two-component system sensor histidine kinase DegS